MAEGIEPTDVAGDVVEGGKAIQALTREPELFEAAIDAFRARDAEKWHAVLGKAQAFVSCHRICEWVCSKECVRLCILLAGAPREPITMEQIGPFAHVLARLTQQPEQIEALVRAVEREDTQAFQEIAKNSRLRPTSISCVTGSVMSAAIWSAGFSASASHGSRPS